MCAIVSNTDYIKPISLKFKAFIFNSNNKLIYNFYMCENNIPRRREGSNHSPGEKFFNIGIFKKNTSKYAKLMVEPYICYNLRQTYRLFLTKKF